MQRRQAFKFELRPDGGQRRQMRRFAGARRFVFNNKGRALQKDRFERSEKRASHGELCRVSTGWNNAPELRWLKEAPSQVFATGAVSLAGCKTDQAR